MRQAEAEAIVVEEPQLLLSADGELRAGRRRLLARSSPTTRRIVLNGHLCRPETGANLDEAGRFAIWLVARADHATFVSACQPAS